MASFVLYLLESGMCLALLYMVYFLFFKNETYFNFNRIYLLAIMFLSLVLPIAHVTVVVSAKDDIETTFQEIEKFRGYYTRFVSLAEGEFSRSKYRSYEAATFEDQYNFGERNLNLADLEGEYTGIYSNERAGIAGFGRFNILTVITAIYILGVLFFLVRLVVLLFWLAKTVQHNQNQTQKDYKLVLMDKEVPPFSFFRYIFVAKEATQLVEFEQVLAHEKVHVGQLHSLDLIIAHALAVFQWFNPLVWHLQKAIKTTHEYIADSKVVNQGFELFDYQSLLLSQLVSIQSVELVNNFNLVSIKKRITMMTKNKSRFSAKLKALVIIPMALVAFFLFAHMTVKSPVLSFTNYGAAKVSNLDGIWENSTNTFGKLLLFKDNNLSILESVNEINVIDLSIIIKDSELQINSFGPKKESLKYNLNGNELKIWWNDNEFTTYVKTDYKDSFDALSPKAVTNFNLPLAKYATILDKPKMVIPIYVFPDKYLVGNTACNSRELKNVLTAKISGFNKLDRLFITTRLVVDKNTAMEPVYDLYQVLRELSLLRISYGSFPIAGASELQFHYSGLTQMLPPTKANGAEIMDRDAVKDRLIVLVPGGDLSKKSKEIETFIRNHPDYIVAYDWKNTTAYGDYIAGVDMFFGVIYELRNEYTLKKYNLKYIDLPDELQKEARKECPMRLSQSNRDEENND